jgi:hypothetical protein
VAHLLVAKGQIGSVDEVMTHARWDRERDFFGKGCVCGSPLPDPATLRREIQAAFEKGLDRFPAEVGMAAPKTVRV